MDINFGEDTNVYDNERNSFEFPSNIRQIGCIDEKTKIYVEDYVYTYLYQYAKASQASEKIAVLVGRHFTYDECEVVIISGAIQGKYTANQNGGEVFTDETWSYVNEQMKIYFRECEIVGWVHTMSGYGGLLMAKDEEMHKMYFSKSYHQLFIIDAEDKMDKVFAFNQNGNGMREIRGYFIYYDKNRNMQEYMLENSLVKSKDNFMQTDENKDNLDSSKQDYTARIDAAKKIRSVLKEREEKVAAKTRAKYRALTGICGMLCFFCFIMALGIINSSKRINQLETEVVSVKTQYIDISEQIQNNAVASVFAAQKEEAVSEKENVVEEVVDNNEEKEEEAVPASYVVKDGDTLSYISTKFYGDTKMVDKIMEVNGINDPNKIIVGNEIILP